MKPYRYRRTSTSFLPVRVGSTVDRRNSQKETFAGQINGIKASDLEERYNRSLNKFGLASEFRIRISSPLQGKQYLTQQFKNDTGEVEIDFLVSHNGQITPVFIDGEIGHFFTDYQADHDALKTNGADDFGKTLGWLPSIRVPFWKLTDQETTDRTVREEFSGQFVATTKVPITVDGGKITNTGSGYEWRTPGQVVEETTNTRIMRMMKYEENRGFA